MVDHTHWHFVGNTHRTFRADRWRHRILTSSAKSNVWTGNSFYRRINSQPMQIVTVYQHTHTHARLHTKVHHRNNVLYAHTGRTSQEFVSYCRAQRVWWIYGILLMRVIPRHRIFPLSNTCHLAPIYMMIIAYVVCNDDVQWNICRLILSGTGNRP